MIDGRDGIGNKLSVIIIYYSQHAVDGYRHSNQPFIIF